MKQPFLILTGTALAVAVGTIACNAVTRQPQMQEITQTADTGWATQVHPVIKSMFYNLPLEMSRLDLRAVIVNDARFVLTDTTFNNFEPSSFFKGVTADKGLMQSNPDSIQVLLFHGNASLVTEKGGQEDSTKHPMGVQFKYFFSNNDSVEMEYRRLLHMVYPLYSDTTLIKDDRWEAQFSKTSETCIGKIFDHFNPYYRVQISNTSVLPIDGSKPVFVLEIVFSKEDK